MFTVTVDQAVKGREPASGKRNGRCSIAHSDEKVTLGFFCKDCSRVEIELSTVATNLEGRKANNSWGTSLVHHAYFQ